MTQFVIANNVNTQLAAAAASGATTLTLASSANLPTLSAGQIMPLTLNDAATGQSYEIVYVTAISGVTLTVTRAQEGTGALNWSIGDYAYCAPTAGTVAMTTGNPSDTFQVAAATALNNAPQAGQVQRAAFNYAGLAGGTANALTATLTPAPASYTDDLTVIVRVASNNTGATTLNVNGLGATTVVGSAHQALQGGELVAGGFACFAYSQSLTQFVLVWSTGGSEQVGAATASQHAVQLGQVAGVVGSVRNLYGYLSAAGTSVTITADEIIVETGLGGLRYCAGSFNKTFNGATTGAGGMDTGSLPTSGYVGIYAIYNPTTNTWALLGTNATSSAVGNVYGGANMPSGYAASALLTVWPTNGSNQLVQGLAQDREFSRIFLQVLTSTSTPASFTSLSISGAVPPNAKSVGGTLIANNSTTATIYVYVAADANGLCRKGIWGSNPSTSFEVGSPFDLRINTAQTLYWESNTNGGTLTTSIEISRYMI